MKNKIRVFTQLERLIKKQKKPKFLTGFTLIELLVVIVILGILVAVVSPRIMERPEQARQIKARVDIENFESALKLFKLDNGFYPSTEQGLVALVKKPTIGKIPSHWPEEGYLEKEWVSKDPWSNPYIYLSPGIHNKDFDIISYGADSEEGGEGYDVDIGNWEIEEGE